MKSGEELFRSHRGNGNFQMRLEACLIEPFMKACSESMIISAIQLPTFYNQASKVFCTNSKEKNAFAVTLV